MLTLLTIQPGHIKQNTFFSFPSGQHYKFYHQQKIQVSFLLLMIRNEIKARQLEVIWKFCQRCMIQLVITLYNLRMLSGMEGAILQMALGLPKFSKQFHFKQILSCYNKHGRWSIN